MELPFIIGFLVLGSVWLFVMLPSIETNKVSLLMFRGMLVLTNVFILVILSSQPSLSATFNVYKYTDTENHYISMYGKLAEGDLTRLNVAYNNPNIKPGTSLYLESPGGRQDIMIKIVKFVVDKKIETVAVGDCFSACAVIWTQGSKRYAKKGAEIGFHVASYRGKDLSDVQRDHGYSGLQSFVQRSFKDSISYYLELPNIDKNGLLALSILKEGYNANNFFMITEANSDIIGKEVRWY